jgi:hypothetical protein
MIHWEKLWCGLKAGGKPICSEQAPSWVPSPQNCQFFLSHRRKNAGQVQDCQGERSH